MSRRGVRTPAGGWAVAVLVAGVIGAAPRTFHAQTLPATAGGYLYVIGTLRLTGRTETTIERNEFGKTLRERLGGEAGVELAERCPPGATDCELIDIEEIDKRFQVHFNITASQTDRNHGPWNSPRFAMDEERMVWQCGQKKIVEKLWEHLRYHARPLQQGVGQ